MRGGAIIAVLLLLCLPVSQARAEVLTIDLSSPRVDITTGFNGTDIIVYGVTDGRGDVALTLFGPERTMVVRRKKQVMGAWLNLQSVEFHRVPGYYDYALSAPLPPAIAAAHYIGLSALDFYHEETNLSEGDDRRFRDALIRNKQAQGLFPLQGRPVREIQSGFFKAVFPLPANVPSGTYRINAYLVNGEKVTAQAGRTLQVGQVGFSAGIYLFAHNHALIYGFLAILMALAAGWGAFTFLRRD